MLIQLKKSRRLKFNIKLGEISKMLIEVNNPEIIRTSNIETDLSKLNELSKADGSSYIENILSSLRQDNVVLVKALSSAEADTLMADVAEALQILDELEIQAGFASIQGHRENIGNYYMSVNKRENYEFIPPHSEGTSSINMQLASFYCFQNTTDGGESILLNVNSDSPLWKNQRELVVKARVKKSSLSAEEVAQAKLVFNLDLKTNIVQKEDEILQEIESPIPGVELYDVLSPAEKTYSKILEKDLFAYWDSIASADSDSAQEYFSLLTNESLIHHPASLLPVEKVDNANDRRVWNSGVNYAQLFNSKIVIKLSPGDLILMNNLSWVHSANNWTPGSGVRKISAAFA